MNNIMIDIETLGTRPGCSILSIGAVEFDSVTLGKEFYTNIDPASCAELGLTEDSRTVTWWSEQSEEARAALTSPTPINATDALIAFASAFDWRGKQVWCNGAAFDFPILEAALYTIGLPTPWKFWDANDFRTLKNLVGKKVMADIRANVGSYVAHNALDDAKDQALCTIGILNYLRGA